MYRAYDESDSICSKGESYSDDVSWISWYCDVKGHEFIVKVDPDFIRDDFNLADTILDEVDEEDDEDNYDEKCNSDPYSDAERLYKLIHARYILTNKGMVAMFDKYSTYMYGVCPRIYCDSHPLIPVGLSDVVNIAKAKVLCPRCGEIYTPKSGISRFDGAMYGTNFAQAFLMQYSQTFIPKSVQYYVPEAYGFKIYPFARDILAGNKLPSESKKLLKGQRELAKSYGKKRNWRSGIYTYNNNFDDKPVKPLEFDKEVRELWDVVRNIWFIFSLSEIISENFRVSLFNVKFSLDFGYGLPSAYKYNNPSFSGIQ